MKVLACDGLALFREARGDFALSAFGIAVMNTRDINTLGAVALDVMYAPGVLSLEKS